MAAIYYSTRLGRRERLLLSLLGIAVITAPSSYGLARAYYGYNHFGPLAASTWGLPWIGLAVLLFLAWLLLVLALVRRSRFGILLSRNGMRLGAVENPERRLPGRLPPLIPWEQIAGIAVKLTAASPGTPPICQARLDLKVGRTIRLAEARSKWDSLAGLFGPSRIENLPELVTRIKAHLYPRLSPALAAAYLAGETVAFGPVAVQSQGILLPGRRPGLIAWRDTRRVTVRSGELVVELEKPGKKPALVGVPVSEIPNLELLLKLIEAYSC